VTTISTVIPCFNGADFLDEALRSVHGQTRAVDEIIVVDDGSTDDSVSIARREGAICLSTGGRAAGPSAARNIGIRAARGDVIAFLDADDYWEPAHCELVVGLLDRHPDAAVAFSRERRIGDWEGEHDRVLPEDQPVDAFWPCLRRNMIPQMGVAVRRAALLAVGGYDETRRYSEDYDLWLKLARRYPFVCSHAVTCNHRGHAGQLTRHPGRLARGAYEARYRVWREAVETAPPDFVARVEGTIREAWQGYLRTTWKRRNREEFDAALDLRDLVPGSDEIHDRWALKARHLWRWHAGAGWVWDRLPLGIRTGLRGSLRVLTGAR
jgi:GT2 family glycosyltransferase